MRANTRATFLVLTLLTGFARAQEPTDTYDELTDDLTEFANFHPEPFAGIALDLDGGILAVNPYNNTWVRYAGPAAGAIGLRAQTGHNPVSIGVWDRGPAFEDRRILVVCTGSHAAFLHHPNDGRILNVLLLDSEPADLEIDQENDRAFVSCRGDNTVLEIDLVTFRVSDRFPIGCGQRPGPLYLDRGSPSSAGDERVYVAPIVTGNNTIPVLAQPVSFVVDLDAPDLPPLPDLPDQDVFRIDPALAGEAAVTPVLRKAGSLIFELARNPSSDELWILSSRSLNAGIVVSEPMLKGKFVINQLERADVDASSVLTDAPDGLDLDDLAPGGAEPTYDPLLSVNQVRAVAFQSDGEAYVASPMSDVIAHLSSDGTRLGEFRLPRRAQCYDLAIHGPSESTVLALCLGTMTIEVFTEGTVDPVASLALGNDPTPLQVRQGRDIMLDGLISASGRSTCFACHEGGRSDQLGWSIAGKPTDTKDVMVTQSLLSIEDTFPHHWRGERDLPDFRKAFVGLLGAPEELAPTAEEMEDVNAFIRSLKAPANPLQNYRRLLDDRVSPLAPDGVLASAVRGQTFFQGIENFNGNTCAECHTQVTGSNGNMFAEVDSIIPRVQELEVAHLRQLQHKGLDTVTLTVTVGEQVIEAEVNENGFGATHNGVLPSVFRFIFDTFPFVQAMSDQQRRDVFEFVDQFDQGIAPGVHWAVWYRQGSTARVENDIQQILVDGAENGWLDVVVDGRFHDGTALKRVRWLYDRVLHAFVTDDPLFTSKTWVQFKAATQAGQAENAFYGVPPGNGRRIAFDPDADDLTTGEELALGTDPWNPHSDGDRWPDGYEDENDEDPLVGQTDPGDESIPDLDWAELEFVTARVAKVRLRTTEDVTYVVEYGQPGGDTHEFRRDYFVRSDTCVLTHSSPSTPIDPDELHKPDPDGALVFSATITLTDRAGNESDPLPLVDDFTPLAAQLQDAVFVPDDEAFPPAGAFLHVGKMTATVDSQTGDSLTATVVIEPDFHYQDPVTLERFDADGRVVVCTIAVQDPLTGEFVQSGVSGGAFSFVSTPAAVADVVMWDDVPVFGIVEPKLTSGIPGPFVMCAPTQNGSTQFTFTQSGLSFPGQEIKVAVQAVLNPIEVDDGLGGTKTVLWARSRFDMQPLLTEDDEPDTTGPEHEAAAPEVVIVH